MRDVITYSLIDSENSNRFYDVLSQFTDEFLNEGQRLAFNIIEAYGKYIEKKTDIAPSAKEEYLFEFLMLGTLWQIYSGDSMDLQEGPQQLLVGLSESRQSLVDRKPDIDWLKGIFSTMFLSPDLDDNIFVLEPNMEHFHKLISWLSATGEFDQEVKRLLLWEEFFKGQSQDESSGSIALAIALAGWFEMKSNERLGHYTRNVESYLRHVRPSRYWKEDVIFSGRRKAEYHLNMVGAEIMNRANRDAFLKASHRSELLPSCMCEKPEGKCMAKECPDGLKCMLCSPSCRVKGLTELGKKNAFDVYIITHESSTFSGNSGDASGNSPAGIVGIACPLNLVSGGWKAKNLGLPAQCVLLDYCGCKKHWHETGIVTDINLEQLKKILEIPSPGPSGAK